MTRTQRNKDQQQRSSGVNVGERVGRMGERERERERESRGGGERGGQGKEREGDIEKEAQEREKKNHYDQQVLLTRLCGRGRGEI